MAHLQELCGAVAIHLYAPGGVQINYQNLLQVTWRFRRPPASTNIRTGAAPAHLPWMGFDGAPPHQSPNEAYSRKQKAARGAQVPPGGLGRFRAKRGANRRRSIFSEWPEKRTHGGRHHMKRMCALKNGGARRAVRVHCRV